MPHNISRNISNRQKTGTPPFPWRFSIFVSCTRACHVDIFDVLGICYRRVPRHAFCDSSHDTCPTWRPGNATYYGAHQVNLSFAVYLNVLSSGGYSWVYAFPRATIDYICSTLLLVRQVSLELCIHSPRCAAAQNNTRYSAVCFMKKKKKTRPATIHFVVVSCCCYD